MNCYAKEDAFSYPKMYEEASGKEVEKVATAVLSTTARAKARAKKTKKEKGPNEEEKKKEHEEKEKGKGDE